MLSDKMSTRVLSTRTSQSSAHLLLLLPEMTLGRPILTLAALADLGPSCDRARLATFVGVARVILVHSFLSRGRHQQVRDRHVDGCKPAYSQQRFVRSVLIGSSESVLAARCRRNHGTHTDGRSRLERSGEEALKMRAYGKKTKCVPIYNVPSLFGRPSAQPVILVILVMCDKRLHSSSNGLTKSSNHDRSLRENKLREQPPHKQIDHQDEKMHIGNVRRERTKEMSRDEEWFAIDRKSRKRKESHRMLC